MPSFHAYVPRRVAVMVREIMSHFPDESLSGLFTEAVEARHAALLGCRHHDARCVQCGAKVPGYVPRE